MLRQNLTDKPSIFDFARFTSYGEIEVIEKILESLSISDRKIFLHTRTIIISRSMDGKLINRRFECTAFEYACWALDNKMCDMFLKYMLCDEALKQINDLEEHGTEQGKHFDFKLIIEELLSCYQLLNTFKNNFKSIYEKYPFKPKPLWDKNVNYVDINSKENELTNLWIRIAELQQEIPGYVFRNTNYAIRKIYLDGYVLYQIKDGLDDRLNQILNSFCKRMDLYQKLQSKLEIESAVKHQAVAAPHPIRSKAYTNALGFWNQRELCEREQRKAQIRSSLGLL